MFRIATTGIETKVLKELRLHVCLRVDCGALIGGLHLLNLMLVPLDREHTLVEIRTLSKEGVKAVRDNGLEPKGSVERTRPMLAAASAPQCDVTSTSGFATA